MYEVRYEDWQRMKCEHPDYICKAQRHESNGKVCNAGDYACFESLLSGNPADGTTLIFEHIHFEIV